MVPVGSIWQKVEESAHTSSWIGAESAVAFVPIEMLPAEAVLIETEVTVL
jgi:hypothetical protein